MSSFRFLLLFAGFNLLLAALPMLADLQWPTSFLLIPKFWSLFLLFDGFTVLVAGTAKWRMAISNKASGQVILATITLRFLFCMIIVLVYLRQNSVDPVRFIACFFYLYFFHSIFEIYCMLCNLRNQNFK